MKSIFPVIVTVALLTSLSGCVVHPTNKVVRVKANKPNTLVVVDTSPSRYVVVKKRVPNKGCIKYGNNWRCKG